MILHRQANGRYQVIHGHGVEEHKPYRGWDVRRHWGGWQAFRTTREGMEIETQVYPMRAQVFKAIEAWEANERAKFGIEGGAR